MRTYLKLIIYCCLGLACSVDADSKDLSRQDSSKTNVSGAWPFYAFCMDTHDAKKRTLGQQATMLKDLGYTGCGHLWLDGVETRAKTLSDAGLRLYQVYLRVDLKKPHPLDEKRIAEILPLLKPHRTQLALLITGGAEPSDTALDDKAVSLIRRIADMAGPHDVTIALYPHTNHWLETSGDAVRIARKVNRPDKVGAMFNLCHWMRADAKRDLRAVLEEVQPWLTAVSLSGSDTPEQVREGKGKWIQPLDQGAYDIRNLMCILREIGFSGPIGLQCWGIPGDARAHLERSIAAWKRAVADDAQSGLAFISSGNEQYRFDTGNLRGTLRGDGKSSGLSALLHVPSGTRLDGARHGIFSHYRVFTTNQRYGHAAWDWPSTSKILPDGALQVHWPAGEDHPFELTAVYRWSRADTLDLETTVKAQRDLTQFEVFLASYFQEDFSGSSVYVKNCSKTEARAGFATTERSFGDWQMFPRNSKAVSLIKDGRWQIEPHPVKWSIRQNLAAPLGIRRDRNSGLCAIIMAGPEDCFALATPYQGEGHFSLYLSLFGREVRAQKTATVHSRLVIASAPTEEQVLALYRSYIKDLEINKQNKTYK